MFDIPVCLFIFKRQDKSVQIIREIAKHKPQKLYIIADAGRNAEEHRLCEQCRKAVENAIDWDCTIVKMYAKENRGCFGNIGLGAREVFEKEAKAIFLEDDNLPEETFLPYCRELLYRYESNDDILWICGTNYMTDFVPSEPCDYVFTRHLLPCGWASWSSKFLKYYDYDFTNLNNQGLKQARKTYQSLRHYRYDVRNWKAEKAHNRFYSWDYQMNFSIRFHNKYGIAPCKNQITNIGADSFSAHGGTSMDNCLTAKFCEVPSARISFPLRAPSRIAIDPIFEKKTREIIVPPRRYYFRIYLRRILPIPRDISISKSIKVGRIIKKAANNERQ